MKNPLRTIARSGIVLLLALAPLSSDALAQGDKRTAIPARFLHGLGGCFELYDRNAHQYTKYHPRECKRALTPASTFKILNSLIGLETGVIADEHFVIPWDSVQRPNPVWNRDHDLASAIANSVVWYYQEAARRVGEQRMAAYVDSTRYGNMDISGGIDRFWLGSTLLISADQQVGFLRRLYNGTLPFSQRSMNIVKDILVLERTPAYVLRGKTGFATDRSGLAVGWFVGYVEKGDNVYIFAFNMTSRHPSHDSERIFSQRQTAAMTILKEMGIL